MEKKSKYEKLVLKEKSAWLLMKEDEKKGLEKLSREYLDFLNQCKTERECVSYFYEAAVKKGFTEVKDFLSSGSVKPGRKIVSTNRNKNIILTVVGKRPMEEGLNIICAHMDSPRLDLKQNPLYEDTNLVFLKTHYYGGIKKFHWLNIPLAIHGRIVKINGETIDLKLGEKEEDPVFLIPDLLPHLSKKLSEKTVTDAFQAENLNLVMGHIPVDEDEKEAVKINILKMLNEQYGFDEKDFNSAELEIVPSLKAREAGFDRSFIAGYGQDDRISSFLAFQALMNTEQPDRTSVVLLIDKEEVGSEGNSSIQSKFFELFISDLLEKTGKEYSEKVLKKTLYNSYAISADVDSAFDPNYKDVFDIRNTSKIGYGLVLVKYTGHGGKYGASDANAEYMARIRKLLTDHQVIFQFGSIGKIDEGGGGTISKFLASYGMEIVDAGTPVLGMHSPYELTSKADLHEALKAFTVFFSKM
ncbi:MAG: aminopeptidase [bacterium]|nr:aminopeptidase [bacterium]